MKRRAVLLAAFAGLALTASLLGGCLAPGPINNRLVLKEWKAYKHRNTAWGDNWRYSGEHWEWAALPLTERAPHPER